MPGLICHPCSRPDGGVGQRRGIAVHGLVYSLCVKRRDLEKMLTESGWYFLRRGGKHDVWSDGEREEAVPRHREINENLARAILRRVNKERT
ncbi:MAG TPA: type II toxin-antitoxin system HicA family toxin [Thermoanaerobaculia bacterium]|nr:type II toxin-antitoxin system HicA family toxin [Thermoanaerobaculia bacterium]